MLRVSRSESDCALAVLDQYYRLRQKRLSARLDPLETRTLAQARNYFEPTRMTPKGPLRQPLRIDTRRSAILKSADGKQPIEIVQVRFREVDVRLTRLLPVSMPVVLELRGWTNRPFRFAGRIGARQPGSDRAIIRLGVPRRRRVRCRAGKAVPS